MQLKAPKRSKAAANSKAEKSGKKELSEKEREMRAKFAFFRPGYNGEGVEKLTLALATGLNKIRPTRVLPFCTDHDDHYFRVFGHFVLAGFVLPHSFFLHGIMELYGLQLAQLHPSSFFKLAVFQHLCEAFVGVMPSVALFRHYYYSQTEKGAPMSSRVVIPLPR